MPRLWPALLATLSLTVLLICSIFSLHMTSIDRYVCIGCQAGVPAGHASYFPTYKAAACYYARSRACNLSNRGIRLVTIQSLSSDREAGGSGGAGQWPPGRPAGIYHGMYEEADNFIARYISVIDHTFLLLNHTFLLLNHTLLLLSRQKKC